MGVRPVLFVLGGLPGTGKTHLARSLSRHARAVHLRIDTIEQALRNSGEMADGVRVAGYAVAYEVAADNLKLGRAVIADSVNPIAITRNAWREVAVRCGALLVEIELACSDTAEHRRRVETRQADIAGHEQPTWQQVKTRDYEDWDSADVVIDTALATTEQALAAIDAALERKREDR